MSERTKEELEHELGEARGALELERKLREERGISDDRYARKIIEGIVFAIIGIFALAALYFVFVKVGLPKP